MMIDPNDRRTVLRGVAGIGAVAALAACGGNAASITAGKGSGADTANEAGTSLGNAAEVPVGSGKIYADQKIVVTQPTAGNFKAFSAVCTHQGCIVTSVDSSTINCACHGSAFSTKDGSVVNGPATRPLPPKTVTEESGTLKLG